jgi:hypothetical protein
MERILSYHDNDGCSIHPAGVFCVVNWNLLFYFSLYEWFFLWKVGTFWKLFGENLLLNLFFTIEWFKYMQQFSSRFPTMADHGTASD